MKLHEFYEKNGSDFESVRHRFCSDDAMVLRFVLSFPEDSTFGRLSAAVDAMDYQEMESQSHALKGMAGNLGFDRIYSLSAQMDSDVRQGNFEAALQNYEKIKREYDGIMADIQLLKKDNGDERQ